MDIVSPQAVHLANVHMGTLGMEPSVFVMLAFSENVIADLGRLNKVEYAKKLRQCQLRRYPLVVN